MGTFQSIQEAREYFKGDKFAADNHISLDALDGERCLCSMEILPEHHQNAAGGVMGGVIFTLGDFAFAVASNSAHRPTVALSVSINYLSAPKGKKLLAKTRRVKDGRTTCVYEVEISDELGNDVAQFIGTGFKLHH